LDSTYADGKDPDDEPINLSVIRTILTADGHDVVAVSSGLEALRRCRSGETDFAAVLLDVQMPVLNGLETAICLRQVPEMANVPIVFISARASQTDQAAGFAAGGNHYLTKPFKRQDLLAVLASIVGRSRASGEEIA